VSAPPDAGLREFLSRVSRRLAWTRGGLGAAAGLIAALPVALLVTGAALERAPALSLGRMMALALLGVAAGVWLALRRGPAPADAVERRAPKCRNVVITAAELLDRPGRVRPWIASRVQGEAARLVLTLDPAALFPGGRTMAALAAAVSFWTLTLVLMAARPATLARALMPAAAAPSIRGVEIVVIPPAYTGLKADTRADPARIEAFAGSRVQVSVAASAAEVSLQTLSGSQVLAVTGAGRFTGELVAEADGYLALEPTSGGLAGARRLIGLAVRPDAGPAVRLTAPGRDLLLPDARRTIAVTGEAHDDLALAWLELRYTRVSGSGEQFTFVEGGIPLAVQQLDERTWRARGILRLDTMRLGPGDMVVYRGVAADRRPGAAPVESDAFIIEIRSPGSVAAEGFAIDDEEDRYAISQQMVILKTERLIARATGMSPDSVAQESQLLAAEQRAVRAEFVFMMGGELAEEILAAASMADLNEEAHAAADDEVIAGRLVNQGRDALLAAIRAMSRANTALVSANLPAALTAERTALANLERAFSRTRYILRALTQRERLDLTRRLTGVFAGAGRDVRPQALSQPEPRVVALRRILAEVAALAGTPDAGAGQAATALRIAETVLRTDPSAEPLRDVAARLTDAANALRAGRPNESARALDEAAALLTTVLRSDFGDAPAQPASPLARRLGGALADALRRTNLP